MENVRLIRFDSEEVPLRTVMPRLRKYNGKNGSFIPAVDGAEPETEAIEFEEGVVAENYIPVRLGSPKSTYYVREEDYVIFEPLLKLLVEARVAGLKEQQQERFQRLSTTAWDEARQYRGRWEKAVAAKDFVTTSSRKQIASLEATLDKLLQRGFWARIFNILK